jgi:hypothetical protein
MKSLSRIFPMPAMISAPAPTVSARLDFAVAEDDLRARERTRPRMCMKPPSPPTLAPACAYRFRDRHANLTRKVVRQPVEITAGLADVRFAGLNGPTDFTPFPFFHLTPAPTVTNQIVKLSLFGAGHGWSRSFSR